MMTFLKKLDKFGTVRRAHLLCFIIVILVGRRCKKDKNGLDSTIQGVIIKGIFSFSCVDGHTAKFVRFGVSAQLSELVDQYYDSILSIRGKLRREEAPTHNLASPFFRPLWQTEPEGNVYLSGVLSVDGVSVPGNKK